MGGWFKSIQDLLTYKPKEDKSFELLENETEGYEGSSAPEVGEYGSKVSENSGGAADGDNNSSAGDGISTDLATTLEIMKQKFNYSKNSDFIIRHINIAGKLKASLMFIDGMVNKDTLNRDVLPSLLSKENEPLLGKPDTVDLLIENMLTINSIRKEKKLGLIIEHILSGSTAIFIEGYNESVIVDTRGFEKRQIGKPETENVVLGAQEGFTENLATNISLIRRTIKNRNLITEILPVGRRNNLFCAIIYFKGLANPAVIKEVKRRIKSINTDYIGGDGMLSHFIEDYTYMILPQILSTERPDRVASFLTEGMVAVISEGTPFAEVMPVTFYHFLQTSEDSFLRWQYGTFLRLIRIFGIFVSTFLPAVYVAITLFHQEMIPTELLASIAQSKETVPLPTVAEIMMLEVSFELIREGGIRIPGFIGQTLGIIGALILGQAAVAAGLVSPILIIVVAVTGLGSFAIPNYSFGLGLRIIRFFFTVLGAVLGFYGISLGIFFIGSVMCNMKSFGVPFFSPIAPKTKSNSDLILRKPVWMHKQRPDYLNTPDRKRQAGKSRGWKQKKGEAGKS